MERGNGGAGKGGSTGGQSHPKVMFRSLEESTEGSENLGLIGSGTSSTSRRNAAGTVAQIADIFISGFALSAVVPLTQVGHTTALGTFVQILTVVLLGTALGSFLRGESTRLNNAWVTTRSIFYSIGVAISIYFVHVSHLARLSSNRARGASDYYEYIPLVFFLFFGLFSVVT